MEAIKNDSRGQSSVADALFFFSIASILALFLFVFATNYGTTLRNQTDKEQFREYASSALKTILYTSTPRDPCCTLEECRTDSPCDHYVPGTKPEEIDFLLAAAKEDYADDGNFGDTAVTIKNTLHEIIQTMSTSADYMFFFYMPTEPQYQFPYFLFYRSVNNVNDTGGIQDPTRCSGEKGCHEFWYCKPTDLSSVNQFLFSLSNFSRTSSKARFLSASPIPGQTPRQVDSEVHFVLWPSVTFDDSSPTGAFQALNCCKPTITPENQDVDCYQPTFTSSSKVSGGVSFEIVPNTIRFPAGYTGTKDVAFKLRNKSDKRLEQATVVDLISAPNNCPVQLPSFSLPFPAAVTITNEELQDPNPPHLTEQYSVQGNENADLEFNVGTLSQVQSLYAQAPPTYDVLLYKLDPQSKPVNRPSASFVPCQFELRYRLEGDDPTEDPRILRAQLSISAEQ